MVKESLSKKMINFGYEYAEDIYDHWIDYYVDEGDEESYYKDSYDSNNHPYKDYLSEQIGEKSWHAFCCDQLFEELEFNEDEETSMKEMHDNLYDKFWDGVERFLKEKYE